MLWGEETVAGMWQSDLSKARHAGDEGKSS